MSNAVIDPYNIYSQAEGFEKSAEMLNYQYQEHRQFNLLMPASVSSAFALELYLKCLLFLESNKIPRTHDTKELFYALSKPSQKGIEAIYDKAILQADDIKEFIRFYKFGKSKPSLDLASILESSKNSFQIFRYIFQYTGTETFSGPPMWYLRAAIRETILLIKPEWNQPIQPMPQGGKIAQSPGDKFKNIIKGIKPEDMGVILPYGCLRCGATAGAGLTFVFQKGLSSPTEVNGVKTVAWPQDDEYICPACATETNISMLREYIEEYTGKKMIFD